MFLTLFFECRTRDLIRRNPDATLMEIARALCRLVGYEVQDVHFLGRDGRLLRRHRLARNTHGLLEGVVLTDWRRKRQPPIRFERAGSRP
jgi:hypothetical protein